MSAQRGELRKIEDKELGISPHGILIPACLPPLFFYFSSATVLCTASLCLLALRSLCAWLQRKCLGFTMWWSNEKRRGDSAVSAQRPHLLSFLCSPYLSTSLPLPLFALPSCISIYLLRMQLLPECKWAFSRSILHKYPSEEIILDCWLFDMTHSRGFCWFDCRLTHGSPTSRGWWWMSTQLPCR